MKAKTETELIYATMLVCECEPDFMKDQNFERLALIPRFSNSKSSILVGSSSSFLSSLAYSLFKLSFRRFLSDRFFIILRSVLERLKHQSSQRCELVEFFFF